MSDPIVKFTLFAHAKDASPKAQGPIPWAQFVEGLGPHRFDIAQKKQCPAFSPAEYPPGKPRTEKNVIRVWFGVLDLDRISTAQVSQVCEKLEHLDAVLYTTWGHPQAFQESQGRLWKVRVCVRLSRPVEASEWPSFWQAMTAYFGGLNDPAMASANEIYFGPTVPPGTDPALCHYIVFRGGALDVARLSVDVFGSPVVNASEKVSRERLERVAKRWIRAKDTYRAEMGEALLRVVKGEPYAEPGNSDNVTFQLCQDLVQEIPHLDPASVAAHFAHSLQLMRATPGYESEIIRKLERAQEKGASDAFALEQAQISETKLRIRQAFAHLDPEREHPYTDEELDTFARKLNCSRDELRKRWLIQRGSLFYVLGPGGVYSPAYTDKDVTNAIVRDLAPAKSAGVALWADTAQGPVRKSLPSLMAEFGSVATDYVLDMRAQEARYDSAARLFVEAPCPVRPLAPTYDHAIAQWLEIMSGDALADVLTWIAKVTDLDQVCSALMLTGAPGTGKTLLATGLSRLWSVNQPTDLVSAMAPFNDAIARCPLVLADESLPKDFRGHDRSAEIRKFIAARSRPFQKKFYPESTILGTIRLIITSNGDGALNLSEHLTAHDIEAIGDRFYHLRVNPAAAEFLKATNTAQWVAGDAIARHALYLRDHYPVQSQGRFMIKSPDREFYRGLATRTGIRSAVLQWLIGYLKAPARIDSRGDFGVRIFEGSLYARAEVLIDAWDTYVKNEPVPPTGRVAQALSELSPRRRYLAKPRGGSGAQYREMDRDHLYAWAAQTEFMTRDEIDQALATDTETRIRLNMTHGNLRPN